MIRGVTKNIALTPIGYKDLNPEETFVPYQIDLRNGRLTDAGNWEKRPGYSEWRDVGIGESIELLIPKKRGYAITKTGKVYDLRSTPVELSGRELNGTSRPQYLLFKSSSLDIVIIVDGGNPVKIESNDTALLGGSPDNAKFIGMLSNYVVISGYDDRSFKWCASGNPENWTTGDSGFAAIKMDGQKIKFMASYREKLYFWKDESIEIWYNRGGTTPFVRLNELGVPKGLGADYSPVQANNTWYWFGDDGDFYFLNGVQPEVISKPYRGYLDGKFKNPSELIGFDFRKENSIRWFAPTDGVCVKFDYLKNQISEDNTWEHGQFERMPINSYMELNNEQYFGDFDSTGKVHHWSKDYLDDGTKVLRVYRKFKIKLSESGKRAVCNKLRMTAKRGVQNNSVSNPQLFFRYRFDEGLWSNYRYKDLGIKGDRNPFIDASRLGHGREIEIEVVETGATDYLLKEMFLTAHELGD